MVVKRSYVSASTNLICEYCGAGWMDEPASNNSESKRWMSGTIQATLHSNDFECKKVTLTECEGFLSHK